MVELVTHKIIKSGDVVELYIYEKGYLKGYKKNNSSNSGNSDPVDSRIRSLSRAKKNLRRIINSNVGQYGSKVTTKFLTLTFRENITDVKDANYFFTKFIKRLNYKLFKTKKSKLKYTAVIEFQKRGAIHYHVILYNMPYIDANDIANVWDKGYIKINKIDNIDNVGAYVGEYLGQTGKGQGRDLDDDRLKGQKSYFSSRGLYKPIEITEKEKVEALAEALPNHKITYSATFENEHVGKVSYVQYNLKLS